MTSPGLGLDAANSSTAHYDISHSAKLWWLITATAISPSFVTTAQTLETATITHRAPHETFYNWQVEQVLPDGRRRVENHYVTELATGLNYLKEGLWIPSSEEIELLEGAAVARQGQFQVIFGANLNTPSAIDLSTADGKRFRSKIHSLVYFDASSGESVMLAEIKDSQGQVLPPNQVFYLDAFDGEGVQADVRYTYRKDSFEQDILLRARPPAPSALGLSDEFTRIEVWTEFFDPPPVVKQSIVLRSETDGLKRALMASPDLIDHRLDFGLADIGSGRAFLSGDQESSDASVVVAKDWLTFQQEGLPQRTFLVESVDYTALQPWLNSLPVHQAAAPMNKPDAGLARKKVKSKGDLLSVAKLQGDRGRGTAGIRVQGIKANLELAAVNRKRSVTIDYITLNTSLTNYTFKADVNYYISGTVNLYGPSNILEGGTILKFAPSANASVDVKGVLINDTDVYRPAVFTASTDSTVGESISGGSPTGAYATTALNFDYTTSGVLSTQQNIRILHAATAIRFSGGSGHELRHIQIGNSGTAVKSDNAMYAVRNALGWNLTNALTGTGSTGSWEHATLNGVTNLVSTISGRFTNCLLTAVVATNGLTGSSNVVLNTGAGVYITAGSGAHYLTNNSPYRDIGTTNINSGLAADLVNLTTYAPLALIAVSSDTTLSPQAGRDTSNWDIGYHYPPLDYLASGVVVSSNVTLSVVDGAAIGIDYSSSSWGFDLQNARFHSTGTPLRFNRVVRAHTAQERSGGNPSTRACFYDGNSSDSSRDSTIRFRFTEQSQLVNDGYLIFEGKRCGALEWSHSRVFNPSLVIDTSDIGTLVCGLTNTYWERGVVMIGAGFTSGANVTAHLRNNLIRKVDSWHFFSGSNTWTVRDNLFDSVRWVTNNGSVVENSTNAHFQTSYGLTAGTGNLTLGSLSYQTGPLGKFYQPTSSSLLGAGSRAADLAGLYHFTTTTNQVKETNSVVDIGLHYVAVDTSGNPIDTDGDGDPDYLEDENGDGVANGLETSWLLGSDWGFRVFITRPRSGNVTP